MAFCIAGGMALTAFAEQQPAAGSQDMAAGSANMTAQADGDQPAVSYIERGWVEGAL